MSRIGNQVLTIPNGSEVKVDSDNVVTVKGKNGELTRAFNKKLDITVEGNQVTVKRNSEEKFIKSIHGTTTALIKNMLEGTDTGFKKELVLNGVGYRVQVSGSKLTLNVGYSHPVEMQAPQGVTIEAPSNTELVISGNDKQVVGEFAANIRKVRAPEPYKGKGIKYKDEVIVRKEGKRAGK